MATKLIIEGNAVYEIDEDCLEYQKRKNGGAIRTWNRECGGRNPKNPSQKDKSQGPRL